MKGKQKFKKNMKKVEKDFSLYFMKIVTSSIPKIVLIFYMSQPNAISTNVNFHISRFYLMCALVGKFGIS